MNPEPSRTRIRLSELMLNLNNIKTVEQAREVLLDVVLDLTPAIRAAVLIENTVWEREKSEPEPHLSDRGGIIDEVLRSGENVFSDDGFTICLPMDSDEGGRIGVLYAEASSSQRFYQGDLLLVLGIAKAAAEKIDEILTKKRLVEDNARLAQMAGVDQNLLGETPAMMELKAGIARVAETGSTVLIQGASGTGKEVVARAIHGQSKRPGRFVTVNCSAIPEQLLESELFGHEKGAFTGAIAQKIGQFESASRGTLFLDEIGDMSLALQPKLLRVLQEREFQRVGGTRLIPADVRIIAATNRNLHEAIAQKQFREDLYYRLNVYPVHTPLLRDRVEDIPLLARAFAMKCADRMGRKFTRIHAETEKLLRKYPWPGNVRELQNLMERAMVNLTSGDVVLPMHLPKELVEAQGSGRYSEGVVAAKKALIQNAWIQADGKATRAAEILDLSANRLHFLIRQFGMREELQ